MAYTFISGATGVLGKTYAFYCAERGYNLVITGRKEESLTKLKEEIASLNPEVDVKTVACELSDEKSLENLTAKLSAFDIERIINVAGIDTQKPFAEYTYEKALRQIKVNAESTVAITFSVLNSSKNLKEILTVSSMSGVTPMPYFALYSASKDFLTYFFTALRLELKEKKVKVTTVLPGGIYTRPDILESIKEQGLWGKLSAKMPEYVVKKSMKALSKNKAVLVPGFFNKLLYFLMKITPRAITMRYIAHRWKNLRKDAF